MGNPGFLKQFGLTDFFWIGKAGIIVGKHMGTVVSSHMIKGFPAPLRENDGLGLTDCGQFLRTGITTGTQQIKIRRI
jgi:hypothetical protein